MEEHTIYAEDIQSFTKQFYRFLEDNPGIAVQTAYSPEGKTGNNTDNMDLPNIVLTIVYELNTNSNYTPGRIEKTLAG